MRFIKKKKRENEKKKKKSKKLINFLGHLFNTREGDRSRPQIFFPTKQSSNSMKFKNTGVGRNRISSDYLNDNRTHRSKTDIDNLVDDELNARLSICDGDDDISITFVVR